MAALIVVGLVCAAVLTAVVVRTNSETDAAARLAANYIPALPAGTSSPGGKVTVVSDGTATRAATEVTAGGRWTALLGRALSAPVLVRASVGSGYTSSATSGATFVQAADEVDPDSSAVVFVGGLADGRADPVKVAEAVARALAVARNRAPSAVLYVVGPPFAGGLPIGRLRVLEEALESGCAAANGVWLDPIQDSWLSGASREKKDASALTAPDQQAIALQLSIAMGVLAER